jgi:hypothetical protein
MLLSHATTIAWQATTPENLYNHFWPTVIEARMLITDIDLGKPLRIFQFFAYAPTSDSPEADDTYCENALTASILYCDQMASSFYV